MEASSKKVSVNLKIRRYDNIGVEDVEEKTVEIDVNLNFHDLKAEVRRICNVLPEDKKILKLRNENEELVPFSFLQAPQDPDRFFYLDLCRIVNIKKNSATLLQDAYINSVLQKLRNMESRIVKAELLLPQLEWRRQTHMEDTVNTLSGRVAFLNRRVDELMPAEWRLKMPQNWS